jgi:aminoglycoside 3-N-acetyltransferase
VMLLGVHHDNNTSLHLAEYRTNFSGKASIQEGSAVLVDGARQWINYEIPTLDTDDFQALGLEYEREHHIPIHKIGQADVRLMKQRPLIDWAVGWMERNRADVE